MNFEEATKYLDRNFKEGKVNYIRVNDVYLRYDKYIVSQEVNCIDFYLENIYITSLYFIFVDYNMEAI